MNKILVVITMLGGSLILSNPVAAQSPQAAQARLVAMAIEASKGCNTAADIKEINDLGNDQCLVVTSIAQSWKNVPPKVLAKALRVNGESHLLKGDAPHFALGYFQESLKYDPENKATLAGIAKVYAAYPNAKTSDMQLNFAVPKAAAYLKNPAAYDVTRFAPSKSQAPANGVMQNASAQPTTTDPSLSPLRTQPAPQREQPAPVKTKLPGQNAMACVSIRPDTNPQLAAKGAKEFYNGCNRPVEIFWCFKSNNCSQGGGTVTRASGRAWPVPNEDVQWGACLGANSGGMRLGASGGAFDCEKVD